MHRVVKSPAPGQRWDLTRAVWLSVVGTARWLPPSARGRSAPSLQYLCCASKHLLEMLRKFQQLGGGPCGFTSR